MSDALSDTLAQGREREAQAKKIYGVVVGLVENNKDPEKLGRIKVKFPWMGDVVSHWARLANPLGGQTKDGKQLGGHWWIPMVDDEVLVAFGHGDPHQPYIVGALYNGVDKPPQIDDITSTFAGEGYDHGAYAGKGRDWNEDGKNDLRFIRSRSGHLFIFDDKENAEKITLCDKTGEHRIEIFSKDNRVVITSAGTDGDIELIAERKILLRCKQLYTESREETKMKADAVFEVLSKGDMKHESKANMTRHAAQNVEEQAKGGSALYKAATTITVQSGTGATVKGATVDVLADGMGTVKAGGILTVKGSMVNIN